MQFTRPMVDLIKEIRKYAPADIKPAIKLANPEVFDEIIDLYHKSRHTVLRVLINELCKIAGPEYLELLEPPEKGNKENKEPASEANKDKYITKVYRGQVQLIEAPAESVDESDEESKKVETKRVYRGVEIG